MIQILELVSKGTAAINSADVEEVTNEGRDKLTSTFIDNKDAFIVKLGYGVKMKGNWYRVVELNLPEGVVVIGNKFRKIEPVTTVYVASDFSLFDFSEEKSLKNRKRMLVLKR